MSETYTGRVEIMRDSSLRFWGTDSQGRLLGMELSELVQREFAKLVANKTETSIETVQIELEFRQIHKTPTLIPSETTCEK